MLNCLAEILIQRKLNRRKRLRRGGFRLWPGGDDEPCCQPCVPLTPQTCTTCAGGTQPPTVSVFLPAGMFTDDAASSCSAGSCASALNGATIVMKDCRLRVDDCTRGSSGFEPCCGTGTSNCVGDCPYNSNSIEICNGLWAYFGGGWRSALGYDFALNCVFSSIRDFCGVGGQQLVWHGPSPMTGGKANCSTGHSATLSYDASLSPVGGSGLVFGACDLDVTAQPVASW